MKNVLFLLMLFFSPFVIAQPSMPNLVPAAIPLTVPVVSIDIFRPHKAWSWDYYTNNHIFYSSERYEVISRKGSVVTLEMATKFNEAAPYKFHHRLVVDIQKCLNSYKNPKLKGVWSLQMFNWTGKIWSSVASSTNIAFEEKFNCNSNILKTPSAETLFGIAEPELGLQKIFQQMSLGHGDRSWYFLDGESAGVAAQRFTGISKTDYRYLMIFLGASDVTEASLPIR